MTLQQYRLIGYNDGLNGSRSQHPHVYEYMASFRGGRRSLVSEAFAFSQRLQHVQARYNNDIIKL
jgi:hypothetical protein